MLVCPKCGYKNSDDALYCNLCNKIFRKEKKENLQEEKINSINDLPENIKNLLLQQKMEIMDKGKEEFLWTTANVKKGCFLVAIIVIGFFALILLRFIFPLFMKP
ncbi:MAG: zinc-ribbon domain-containing protein [bacterium]